MSSQKVLDIYSPYFGTKYECREWGTLETQLVEKCFDQNNLQSFQRVPGWSLDFDQVLALKAKAAKFEKLPKLFSITIH